MGTGHRPDPEAVEIFLLAELCLPALKLQRPQPSPAPSHPLLGMLEAERETPKVACGDPGIIKVGKEL